MTTTKVNLANTVEGILPVANGGTGSSTGVSPGGSTTQVQFNNAGAFGGSANLTFDGTTLTAAGLSDSGNLAFTGTGNRITGDFSNATQTNRVVFQTSTTNGNTTIGVIPNGTATTAVFRAFNNSDPTNASELSLFATSADMRVMSNITGSGSYLPLTMYTGGSERLRIDTSGRLIVGGTSAVQGARIESVANTSGDALALRGRSADDYSNLLFIANATATEYARISAFNTSALTFGTGSSGTERMRIDSSGNVGIGTSSPTFTAGGGLQISNATQANLRLSDTTNAAYNFDVFMNDADGYLYNRTSGFMAFGTNNTERMRITSGGNVNIKGDFLLDSDSPQIQWTSGSLRFYAQAASTERMRIDSSGNVGIGTTSPGARLHASGGAIVVDNDWSFGFGSTRSAQIVGSSSTNFMRFETSGTERMRIDSTGALGFSGANYGSSGQVLTSNGSGSAPSWGSVTLPTWSVLQVVQQTYTGHNSGNSTSFLDSGMTVTITPSSTSSKIKLDLSMYVGAPGDGYVQCYVQRNGTTLAIADATSGGNSRLTIATRVLNTFDMNHMSWTYLDSPATTSACTYKVVLRVRPLSTIPWYMNQSESTTDINRITGVSQMVAMELK